MGECKKSMKKAPGAVASLIVGGLSRGAYKQVSAYEYIIIFANCQYIITFPCPGCPGYAPVTAPVQIPLYWTMPRLPRFFPDNRYIYVRVYI